MCQYKPYKYDLEIDDSLLTLVLHSDRMNHETVQEGACSGPNIAVPSFIYDRCHLLIDPCLTCELMCDSTCNILVRSDHTNYHYTSGCDPDLREQRKCACDHSRGNGTRCRRYNVLKSYHSSQITEGQKSRKGDIYIKLSMVPRD